MDEELIVFDQRQGTMAIAYRDAVYRQEERIRRLKYETEQQEAVLKGMKQNLEAFMRGYRL